MHNAAFAHLGLPCAYAALDVVPRAVGGAVELLRIPNVLGANVTVPHKAAVIPFLDRVEPVSRWLDSVNTVFKRGGELVGTSTDGAGFLRSLGPWRHGLRGASALLVGAGGGSRAVAGALLEAGVARLSIMDLDPRRARELVRMLRSRRRSIQALGVSRREADRTIATCGIVVQATPVGLHAGDPSPISLARASRGTLAVDLVYHRRTRFLIEAAKRGMRTVSGSGMLLHQGALSFEFWTGRRAPIAVMERALRNALRRKR
jgi:shikimate dehydrogenase